MKKSELTQLTQIIEHLVAKELKKQLPRLIGEVFANVAGRTIVAEHTPRKAAVAPPAEAINENVAPEQENFKMSMRELFAGATPTGERVEVEQQSAAPKRYTSNPILNQILNETTPDLRQRERMVGGAAFHGGYSPAVAMAASAMGGMPSMGTGEMMSESELPSFARNIPAMPGANPGAGAQPHINESAVPSAAIPEGVSALDVARQVPLAPPVAQALTKNYSHMMKLIDSKRKGKVA
jgi:hypothetical protein